MKTKVFKEYLIINKMEDKEKTIEQINEQLRYGRIHGNTDRASAEYLKGILIGIKYLVEINHG